MRGLNHEKEHKRQRLDNSGNIRTFRKLMASVKREGMDELMDFIEASDFYTAPASTRFHGAKEGGLLEHSLHVYECLMGKKNSTGTIWNEMLKDIPDESIAVAALLHDLCKTNFYKVEICKRNIDGQWVDMPIYSVDDRMPYGHGEKSVLMIEEYVKLTPEERFAIRWHMGPYSGQQDWKILGTAMKMYPLVLALFEADMEATYVMEYRI